MRDWNGMRRLAAVMIVVVGVTVVPAMPLSASEGSGDEAASTTAVASDSDNSGWLSWLVTAIATVFGEQAPEEGDTGGAFDPSG